VLTAPGLATLPYDQPRHRWTAQHRPRSDLPFVLSESGVVGALFNAHGVGVIGELRSRLDWLQGESDGAKAVRSDAKCYADGRQQDWDSESRVLNKCKTLYNPLDHWMIAGADVKKPDKAGKWDDTYLGEDRWRDSVESFKSWDACGCKNWWKPHEMMRRYVH
jgi:hypothetical protein